MIERGIPDCPHEIEKVPATTALVAASFLLFGGAFLVYVAWVRRQRELQEQGEPGDSRDANESDPTVRHLPQIRSDPDDENFSDHDDELEVPAGTATARSTQSYIVVLVKQCMQLALLSLVVRPVHSAVSKRRTCTHQRFGL
eukprot:SAG22_NODE_584_length_8876_cov_42.811667_7_plen_142_part_00